MTFISDFISFIVGIIDGIGEIFKVIGLMFTLIFSLFQAEFVPPEINTGDDLTDYHTVGEVWRETRTHVYNELGETKESYTVFEFEFIEATEDYLTIKIKLVSLGIPDSYTKKEIEYDLWYPYWKKVFDDDGKEYIASTSETIDLFAYYNDMPIDEDGITLCLHYAFETDSPVEYIKVVLDFFNDSEYNYQIKIYPHE